MIYSTRVDSVHSQAYKVLGGINRAGRGDGMRKASSDVMNERASAPRVRPERACSRCLDPFRLTIHNWPVPACLDADAKVL